MAFVFHTWPFPVRHFARNHSTRFHRFATSGGERAISARPRHFNSSGRVSTLSHPEGSPRILGVFNPRERQWAHACDVTPPRCLLPLHQSTQGNFDVPSARESGVAMGSAAVAAPSNKHHLLAAGVALMANSPNLSYVGGEAANRTRSLYIPSPVARPRPAVPPGLTQLTSSLLVPKCLV